MIKASFSQVPPTKIKSNPTHKRGGRGGSNERRGSSFEQTHRQVMVHSRAKGAASCRVGRSFRRHVKNPLLWIIASSFTAFVVFPAFLLAPGGTRGPRAPRRCFLFRLRCEYRVKSRARSLGLTTDINGRQN